MKTATRTEPLSVLTHLQPGPKSSPTDIADTVNEAYLEPMSTFTPLGPDITADARYSNPPSVSEFCVLKKVSVLNPATSSGPDMIPSWLLKENADLFFFFLFIYLFFLRYSFTTYLFATYLH